MLRRVADAALRSRGYELKRLGAPVRGADDFIALLQARGFHPGTVIDVGVCHGTPWLYKFPDAKLVLIDANPRFRPDLEALARQYDADVYLHAVGASAGTLTLHMDDRDDGSASLLSVTGLVASLTGDTRTYTDLAVPVKTLDATLDGRYAAPYLLKLDVEGYEREVLTGATNVLRQTAVVIAEVSVAPRFQGGYVFADLVGLLAAHGFHLFDILSITTLGHGGPINYLDAAFLRSNVTL